MSKMNEKFAGGPLRHVPKLQADVSEYFGRFEQVGAA